MGAIKPDRAGKIDIIVSLDAQTLGLGYYIDPTIVTVDKYTQASYVITDLIKQTIKERDKMDLEGATVDHVSEPDVNPPYAYMMTGTEANSFYLAQVYWPDQSKAKVAEYIKKAATSKITEEGYKDGKYLGEFDYCEKSGWMYSIADRMTGNPSFPGVGAADWRLSDGEVMRWQFTVWGYGADLNADNSAWGQPSITGNSGDKTELTVMIAELRQVYGDKLLRNNKTYFEIHRDVLCNPLATQEELDAAVAKRSQIEEELKDAYAAENAKDLIEAIGTVTLERKAAIEAARAAYEALDTLKDQVSPDALAKLTTAENRLNALQEEVNQVVDLIDALPAVDELTPAHADQVKAARDAYNALNNDQKRLLTENGVLSKLLVAENQMSWLQKDVEAAKKVTDRINSLPAVKDLKLADKTAVQAARNAYEGLSDAQKKYVSAETLKILTDCEAEIARLEAMKPTPSPDPDPNPTPTPTPDPEPSDKTMTLTYQNYPISVTGKLSGYELRLVGLKAADDSVKRMQNKISTREALIRLYNVKLYLNGEEVDWDEQITVNFQVGDKYNGKKLTVLHDVNGSIEKLKGTVSDGILSVTADSLSPFGVVVTASTVTGSGVTNSNSTTTNTTTTVTNGNLNGTTNNTSAEGVTGNVTSAQTGDDTDILLPVAGLIAASGVLAGVVLYYKKKRKNTGVQTEEDK